MHHACHGDVAVGESGQGFAWQQKWNRPAAANPHVCTVLFLLCVSENPTRRPRSSIPTASRGEQADSLLQKMKPR